MRALITQFSDLPSPEDLYLNYLERGINNDDADHLLSLCRAEHFTDGYLPEAEEKADREGDKTNYFEKYNHVQVHAWRALAQLQNPDHVPEFIHFLEQEEFYNNETFVADFKLILSEFYGNAGLEALGAYLFDATNPAVPTCTIVQTLEKIGSTPEAHDRIVKLFNRYLSFLPYSRQVNAYIVNALIKLEAKETLPNIKNVFTAHLVKLPICGDLDSCEIRLGVRKKRLSPAPSPSRLRQLEIREAVLARKEHNKPLLENPTPHDTLEFFLRVYINETQLSSDTQVDGLLTAAACLRNPVALTQLTPYIWDHYHGDQQHQPKWINQTDKKSFQQALKAIYNTIRNNFTSQEIHPLFHARAQENGPDITNYSPWIKGFIMGLDLWQKNNTDDRYQSIINSAYRVMAAEDDDDTTPKKTSDLFDSLIQSIFRFAKKTPATKKTSATKTVTSIIDINTPRNAPCPCGSGKKYKRCCMN